jgi:glucokinase
MPQRTEHPISRTQELRPTVAIDLGGTHLRGALVSPGGEMLAHSRATRPRGAAEIVGAIRSLVQQLSDEGRGAIAGVGISVPGVVSGGRITANNLDWHDFALAEALGDLGIPLVVANDMKAAALGERRFGRGRGLDNLILLTVSTGIGAGIIIGGRIYDGAHGIAGEVGHTVVVVNGLLCSCGRRGCWEMLASGTAHNRRIIEAFESGTWPNLTACPTPQQVTERATSGDRAALALVRRTARYIGIGCANLVNLYDPQAIVFTGGFARANWELIADEVRREVHEQALIPGGDMLLTELGDDAGLLGAATLVLERERGAA